MSYGESLRQLLAPLRVYGLQAPYNGAELDAQGSALDAVDARLEEIGRETCLATAQSWGVEMLAQLVRRRPAAQDSQALAAALAALLRISGDSFTPAAINDTIAGCGVNARVEETGTPNHVSVSFPNLSGVPEGFDAIRAIIEDILPAQVDIRYDFWYLTWLLLERYLTSWSLLEQTAPTWSSLETYTPEPIG